MGRPYPRAAGTEPGIVAGPCQPLAEGASVAWPGHADPLSACRDRGRRGHRRHGGRCSHHATGGPHGDGERAGRSRPPGVRRVLTALGDVRRRRQRPRRVPGGRQPDPGQVRPDPPGRDRRRAGRRGRELLPAQGRERQEPPAGGAGQRLGGRGAPGRLDDHPAARQAQLPVVAPGRQPQDAGGVLRRPAREEVHEAADPRALPQHRLLRQQRLWLASRGRDVLQQERRPAHDGRRRLPRRPDPGPLGLRPVPVPRSGQGPPQAGAGPARGHRPHDRSAGRRRQRDATSGGTAAGAQLRQGHVLLLRRGEGAAGQQDQHPRRRPAGAVQRLLPGRPEDLHDAEPGAADGRRAGPAHPDAGHRWALRRRHRQPRHQDRCGAGDGRRTGVRQAAAEPHAAAPPDRFEREVHDPGLRHRGRRPAQRPDRRHRALHAAQPR